MAEACSDLSIHTAKHDLIITRFAWLMMVLSSCAFKQEGIPFSLSLTIGLNAIGRLAFFLAAVNINVI